MGVKEYFTEGLDRDNIVSRVDELHAFFGHGFDMDLGAFIDEFITRVSDVILAAPPEERSSLRRACYALLKTASPFSPA